MMMLTTERKVTWMEDSTELPCHGAWVLIGWKMYILSGRFVFLNESSNAECNKIFVFGWLRAHDRMDIY